MKIERAEGLAWRKVGEETFIVDLGRKWMYGLNRSAGMVWDSIVNGDHTEDMIRRLAADRALAWGPAEARVGLVRFLAELAELGLVRELPTELLVAADRQPAHPQAPAVTWHEELRAFAASCADNLLVCLDQPMS